jgi:site-specific DNA-adenine methylase
VKSPIKDFTRKHKSHEVLRELIPRGSVVDSFLFYGGDMEFSLAAYDRFVCAHTNNQPVYQLWECMLKDPERIFKILTSDVFKFENDNMFEILQEHWPTYEDPYVRASLFFLLNRCSAMGLASAGELDLRHFNARALMQLKSFKTPEAFHIQWDNDSDFLNTLSQIQNPDYLLIAPGSFGLNLFEHGKSIAHEQTAVHHRKLHTCLKNLDRKWVVVYNYHSAVAPLYEGYEPIMVNKYAQRTTEVEACEEIIIPNF